MLELDFEACYRACCAKDARFDGLFYLGVSSTGIYCRTICRARKPMRARCRFFPNATLAEKAGFRPCKLCRPEQSPGSSWPEYGSPVVAAAMSRIQRGFLRDTDTIESLATDLGVSSRHLRRLFLNCFGASPIQIAQTHRLQLAKRLLAETHLPISQIAMASGFKSLRRCNSLFQSVYGAAPSYFRSELPKNDIPKKESHSLELLLGYRPPFAWETLLDFYRTRAIPGVEHVSRDTYSRVLSIDGVTGWLQIRNLPERSSIQLTVTVSLLPKISILISQVRRAFDLDASPQFIVAALVEDDQLRKWVLQEPGLRLPGTLGGFETAIRAIVGQQISVAAATTLMRRMQRAFGKSFETPFPELVFKSLAPEDIACLSPRSLNRIGISDRRSQSIIRLAREVTEQSIALEPVSDPEQTISRLQKLDGIGPWTANYIAMRVIGWPDAFVASDLIVRKMMSPLSKSQIEKRSTSWKPWRAYAVLHLWNAFNKQKTPIRNFSSHATSI